MLILRSPFDNLWKNKDAFEEVEKISGEIYRSVATRQTLRFEVDGKGFYLKLHHGITYKEFFKNIFSFHMPVFGARNEWLAIEKLKAAGIDTMTGAAYGEKGLNPIKQTSFIITEDLSPTISLEDYCEHWTTNPPPYAVKKALISRVAYMVREMHKLGINHRDCYICHFLLQLPFDNLTNFKLSVIDLHRAQIRDAVPLRWRNKDLVALYYSCLNIGLKDRDYLRFLRIYFPGKKLKQIFADEKDLLGSIQQKAQKIKERTIRKGL